MSAVLVTKEKNKAVFTVEIPHNKFEESIDEVYKKNRKYFSVPGFRKGKVPKKIVELNYGKEVFYEDALNALIPEMYEDAIDELELQPVDQPSVDVDEIKEESPIKVTFEVDVMPEGQLGDYSDLEAEVHNYDVKEEDIQRVIDQQLEENSRLVNIDDRGAKEGDTANIDFKGYHNDEVFEGGEATDYDIVLGSNTFIPGFEDQIIEKKIGDEFDVNVTFPEDYHEESLAGEDVVFKVKLNGLQEKVRPELDDEFVKDISEFDTLDEYKDDVKKQIQKDMDQREKIEKENKAVESLAEKFEVEIPASMIDREADSEFQKMGYQLQNMGIPMEQYLQMMGKSADEAKEELKPQAEQTIKNDLALRAFIDKENIEATEEEAKELMDEFAQNYPEDQRDHMKEHMMEDMDSFIEEAKKRKAIDQLVEMVKYSIMDEENDEKSDEE
ncbi:MAG: trigger factor [Tissierellia bacterium]|nr:trigger factor [Tissierellia bacterium]